jgi:hypothetical protein
MKRLILFTIFLLTTSTSLVRADEDVMPTRETYILLHALNDAIDATDFYDCRISIDGQNLRLARARFHADLDLYDRRSEIKTDQGSVVISGFEQEQDGWHRQEITFKLSAGQKKIVGVHYRESRLDHVNVGTIQQPAYKTVLIPVQRFFCDLN